MSGSGIPLADCAQLLDELRDRARGEGDRRTLEIVRDTLTHRATLEQTALDGFPGLQVRYARLRELLSMPAREVEDDHEAVLDAAIAGVETLVEILEAMDAEVPTAA